MPEKKQTMQTRMMLQGGIFIFLAILAFFLPGCSGGGGPTVPESDNGTGQTSNYDLTGVNGYPASVPGENGGKAVWGVWDVSYDREGGLQVVPLRGVEYSLNVNKFMVPPGVGQPPPIGITMVNMEKLFIAGDCTVDVSLKHPFPSATQFTGFDVLGVLITTGHFTANSDTGLIFSDPAKDPVLKNADGYTRWMNQLEFTTPGLRGYTEGYFGNKNKFWTASLNPYKYFATGLFLTENISHFYQSSYNINERGLFATNSTNTRRYELHFPIINGAPIVKFQYAIVASWKEPYNNPPISVPGDFPAAANMQEAFYCQISTVGSTLYWTDMYNNGGNLLLTLDIFDWQGSTNTSGVMGEIKQIILDSPDEFINNGSKLVFNPGDWVMMEPVTANSARIVLNVGQVKPGGPCPFDNDVLITIVTKEMADYNNGLGGAYPTSAVLSGYARLFYDMGYACNNPPIIQFINCPGGEIKNSTYTIRWNGEDDVTPNHKLEYRYKLDTNTFSPWTMGTKQAYFDNLTETSHKVYVQCRDADGQISQAVCNFSVKLPPVPGPPVVGFNNCEDWVKSSDKIFHLNISDDNTPLSKIKVRYSFNGAPWVSLPDGSTSVSLSGLVSGGPYQLLVEVTDIDSMTDQDTCEFDVNMGPSVSINNCPSTDLNVNSHTFFWTGNDPEGDTLEYQTKVDAGLWSSWGGNTNLVVNSLTSGNHVIYVRVKDPTGGTNQVQCNFKVNFAPTISINNKPLQDINNTSYMFNWTASDDLDSSLTMQYNVQKDGIWQGWLTGVSTYNWNPLSSGPHTFRVRVRDTGNPQLISEDSCTFTVNFKPSVTIDNCPTGLLFGGDYTFEWTGNDDNTPESSMFYSYKLDTNPWSPYTVGQLSVDLTGLTDGGHTFSVRVRDTGNPALVCETPPNSCDTCSFSMNTLCANPPEDVQNFQASDGDILLANRQVRLTWNAYNPATDCVDFYDIERYEYNWVTGWSWKLIKTTLGSETQWMDNDARYSGPNNPIRYRIRARNVSGSSATPAINTGYPPPRQVKVAFWCAADDPLGTNPVVTWPRAAADYLDSNDFWNDYGINFAVQNAGNFFWVGNPVFRNPISTAQTDLMHATYGKVSQPQAINVYYVQTYAGNPARGWCRTFCPGSFHNTQNVYILLTKDVRGNGTSENPIVLPHEFGHGLARLWDQYLLDTNGNMILDDGTTCLANNIWCTTPPDIPWMFCDDNASYPENPGAFGKIPKQLMWYSYAGTPVSDYNLYETQWLWVEDWIHGNEGNYP